MGIRDLIRDTPVARAARTSALVRRYLDRRPPRERAVEQAVKRLVGPGAHAVDVGAHYGSYSKLLADLVGPSGKVTAFEANPTTAAGLVKRVAGRPNVSVVHSAVAEERGTLALRRGFGGRSATWSLEGGTADDGMIQVPTCTLDEALGADAVDFIKIDVEGAEMRVLAGATDVLKRRPVLVIEVHSEDLKVAVRRHLEGLDYTVVEIDQAHVQAEYEPGPRR